MTTGDIDRFADIPDPLRKPGAPPLLEMRLPDEPSPTRQEGARRRWIAVAIATVWLVAGIFGLGLRPDLLRAEVLAQLAVWTLALPLGLSIALRPRKSGWPPGPLALRFALIALAAAFVGLAVMPVSGHEAGLSFTSVGVCLSFALALALPALIGAVLVLRNAFINAPVLRGAMVGAVCGLSGSVGIHSHCPVVTASHVLLAHGLPMILFAVVGAVFGARRGRV